MACNGQPSAAAATTNTHTANAAAANTNTAAAATRTKPRGDLTVREVGGTMRVLYVSAAV